MFTLKQISTIKKVLSEETPKKKEDLDSIDSQKLILKTERLQEIYQAVCLTEDYEIKAGGVINTTNKARLMSEKKRLSQKKNNENREIQESDNQSAIKPSQFDMGKKESRGEISPSGATQKKDGGQDDEDMAIFEDSKELIGKLLSERKSLKNQLTEALFRLDEQKMMIKKQNYAKMKKLQNDLKSYNTLEQTWKKSREALLKENKILMDELNKAQTRIKSVKQETEVKYKSKIFVLKKRIKELESKLHTSTFEEQEKSNEQPPMKTYCHGGRKSSKSTLAEKRRSSSAATIYGSRRRSNTVKSNKQSTSSNREAAVSGFKKKIKKLKKTIEKLEDNQRQNLKDKLCLAFDTFEEEKRKIIDHYKEEKGKKAELIKKLRKNLIKKERMLLDIEENRLKESQNYQKSMMELEELKHRFRLERDMIIAKKIDKICQRKTEEKNEEVEFLLEKMIMEKQELEKQYSKDIENLNGEKLEIKAHYLSEIKKLKQRVKVLENAQADFIEQKENHENFSYLISPKEVPGGSPDNIQKAMARKEQKLKILNQHMNILKKTY